MATNSTIFDATAACRKSLQTCQDLPYLMRNEWAENQLADFNLWAAGAGASARKRASLDQRLDLEPDVKSVVINLLCMLQGFTDRCYQKALEITSSESITTGYKEESKQGSLFLGADQSDAMPTTKGPEPTEQELGIKKDQKNVERTLSQVVRLTVAIRKSGSHSKLQKADSSFNPESHQALREHLNVVVLAKPSESGRELFKADTQQLSQIQSRLIEANLRRHNRFLYAQSHSRKLAEIRVTYGEKPENQTKPEVNAPQKPSSSNKIGTQKSGESGTKSHGAVMPTIKLSQPTNALTATSASAIEGPIQMPTKADSQYSMTMISSTGAKIVYPQPPRIKDGHSIFKCPCCCKALPAYFSKGNWWRKHLAGDIVPYTCILENCPRPWDFYVTREAWMKHMKEEHRSTQYWICFACRERKRFDQQEYFIAHLREKHQGILEDQRSAFLSACMRSTPVEVESCPLCLQETPEDPQWIFDHIAEHVHSFSMRSLPWAPTQRPPGEEENLSDDGNDASYFRDNDYFGGDSSRGSARSTASSQSEDREREELSDLDFDDDDDEQEDDVPASPLPVVDEGHSWGFSAVAFSPDLGWKHFSDKRFASRFFTQLGQAQTASLQPGTPLLCDQCRQIQLPSDGTRLSFNTTSQNCQLCAMILQLFQSSINSDGSVVFYRHGSNLNLREDRSKPSLTIVAIPGVGEIPQDIQAGFPVLPEVGGSIHFSLLREWLRVCDERGKCYENHSQPRLLPTRVLDVGNQENQKLLLHETVNQEIGRYIALSHRWGNPTEAEKAEFCTSACNITERRRGINFNGLPKTFQDAVTVARELGVQYLWIDSMCIKQAHQRCKCGDCGPESGDWKIEAEKMEQYFGSAYCTIAADSAEGPKDGLLQPRQARQYVQVLSQGDTAVYLCKAIDDFDRDVDKGVLNQRGWVFQERALSCRTIHYTNTQTYWECGCKIRCETLGALKPPLQYRLNEPQFPRSNPLTGYPRREIFKFTFQQYSQLSLTHSSDRHVAISGVVERLKKCLDSREIYGIFEKYPQQSLLWRRAGEQRMHRIPETQTTIPSWSWMAYEGGIEYIDLPDSFEENQIHFPSAESLQSGTGLDMELREPARGLNWEYRDGEQQLTFDGENPDKDNKTYIQELKLAIVGREKRDLRRVYVLIVKSYSIESTYERVGVGRILERHMSDVREFMGRVI